MRKIFSYWYVVLIVLFFAGAAGVYIVFGESSYIAVHDNLDLFVAQFRMLKNTGSFFAHGVDVPFLGGVTRDNLPSELSLYTVLYMILPSFAAYAAGYLLKIGIAMGSVWLLVRDWYGERFGEYKPLAVLMGFAYGILNVFPAFGIPFASIPLAVYLLRRIYKGPSLKLYVFLFCYPFLSYFSYFGFFILAYLAAAVLWLWVRDRRVPRSLLAAVFVLAAGYVVFEYRLFGVMLFGGTETIRSTMVEADLTAGEILAQGADVWRHGIFHAESVHDRFIWWVCMFYFVYRNQRYMARGDWKGMFRDIYNLLMLVLVFNSAVYGIYNWGAFRGLVETLVPFLKGFQFNRTVFFNPFLWYAAFFIVLQRMYAAPGEPARRAPGGYGRGAGEKGQRANGQDLARQAPGRYGGSAGEKGRPAKVQETVWRAAGTWRRFAANGMALAAIGVVLLSPTRYNDLLDTCKNKALELLKGKHIDEMSYEEFYSEGLFGEIKEDIGYSGEWSVAYGFHPAVLEYNGIATLDGYLGFYPQQYKEDFRRVIAPALDRVEASRIYYDDWGARAYVYSGSEDSVVSNFKSFTAADRDLYIDTEAFGELGGKYIFSRFELSNAEELGLGFVKAYGTEASPYMVYLYEWKQATAGSGRSSGI